MRHLRRSHRDGPQAVVPLARLTILAAGAIIVILWRLLSQAVEKGHLLERELTDIVTAYDSHMETHDHGDD